MKSIKSTIIFTFIALLTVNGNMYAIQPSISLKTFAIKPIPFSGYKTTSDISGIPIIFSEYGKMVKVSYPAPKELTIQDPSLIIKSCREILSKNVDKIVRTATENSAVETYLTCENKISLPDKEALLGIVTNPRERTFQRNASTGKVVAEFRSKEFDIDDHTKFCIYLTFLCEPEKFSVEEVIISAIRLESEL